MYFAKWLLIEKESAKLHKIIVRGSHLVFYLFLIHFVDVLIDFINQESKAYYELILYICVVKQNIENDRHINPLFKYIVL